MSAAADYSNALIPAVPRPITPEEFRVVQRYIESTAGISLSDSRISLVEGRLRQMLQRLGISSVSELMERVVHDRDESIRTELTDRLTTNHTHFNREPRHYEVLERQVLPDVVARALRRGEHDLRVWCAAASMGQEPYQLAMMLVDHLGAEYNAWTAGVLATDLCEDALRTAVRGSYPAQDVQRLPANMWMRWFDAMPDGRFQVNARLRKEVTFRKFNLLSPRYPFRRPFDVIFCRNVLIYFKPDVQMRVLRRLIDQLHPGGYLFIGHAESLGKGIPDIEGIAPSVFRRR